MMRSPFDPERYKWRKVEGGPEYPYEIGHDYTILGYDAGAVTVNFAATYSPEAKLEGANALGQGIPAYEARMSQLSFDLGVAYRF